MSGCLIKNGKFLEEQLFMKNPVMSIKKREVADHLWTNDSVKRMNKKVGKINVELCIVTLKKLI